MALCNYKIALFHSDLCLSMCVSPPTEQGSLWVNKFFSPVISPFPAVSTFFSRPCTLLSSTGWHPSSPLAGSGLTALEGCARSHPSSRRQRREQRGPRLPTLHVTSIHKCVHWLLGCDVMPGFRKTEERSLCGSPYRWKQILFYLEFSGNHLW